MREIEKRSGGSHIDRKRHVDGQTEILILTFNTSTIVMTMALRIIRVRILYYMILKRMAVVIPHV